MADQIRTTPAEDNSRRTVLIVVSLIAALVVAGVIFLLMRAGQNSGSSAPQHLEGALRAGSPEFDQYRDRIVLDAPEALEGPRTVGDIWMQLETTVRNFTGRTITGLELTGSVVDLQGNPVKEKTIIIIPTAQQTELENNKTMKARVTLESISKDAVRANIKMTVAAVKFKN